MGRLRKGEARRAEKDPGYHLNHVGSILSQRDLPLVDLHLLVCHFEVKHLTSLSLKVSFVKFGITVPVSLG